MQDEATYSRSETLKQARDHFLYLEKFAFDFVMAIDFEHPKITGEQQKVLKFTGRSHRDIQKLSQLPRSPATAAFSDVRGDRAGRTPDLATQTESLVRREFAGEFVSLKGKSVTSSPNVEFTKILHELASVNKSMPPANYLQLKTNNCQLCDGGCHAD